MSAVSEWTLRKATRFDPTAPLTPSGDLRRRAAMDLLVQVYGLIVIPLHRESGFAGGVALAIAMLPVIARASQEVLSPAC